MKNFMPALMMLMLATTLVAFGPSSIARGQTEEVLEQERNETAKFFEQAHAELDAALDVYNDSQSRPANKDLAFYDFLSKSKESQEQRVEGYLDAAAEALGISSISDRRNQIAQLKKLIADHQRNISLFARKKISAPESTYNPLATTKSGYDQKIEAARESITEAKETIEAEKEKLFEDFQRIGMKLNKEDIDLLLDSITGDEFVRVSIIFNNAKKFAAELERLTNESNEDLETARKYYGIYLMLLRSVARMQDKFVENVDEKYYPKLDTFLDQAKSNMEEARKAIRLGGDEATLESNIASNQMTYDAALFYKQQLAEQRQNMLRASLETKKSILTATNSYKTVTLSRNVAKLMATSRRAFEAISSLEVPDLRPFRNEQMKKAFKQMTQELRR